MADTGRRVGPVEAKHPITGSPKSLEAQRLARNPIAVARKEGWRVFDSLGEPAAEKNGRRIVDIDQTSAYVFSDAIEGVLVLSYNPQVLAALRGTPCLCLTKGADGGTRSRHEDSCPLSKHEWSAA